jgi:hypothetical protein
MNEVILGFTTEKGRIEKGIIIYDKPCFRNDYKVYNLQSIRNAIDKLYELANNDSKIVNKDFKTDNNSLLEQAYAYERLKVITTVLQELEKGFELKKYCYDEEEAE